MEIKNKKMAKYTALKPFATTKEYLIINGDIVYCEIVEEITFIYSSTSRQYLGNLPSELDFSSYLNED